MNADELCSALDKRMIIITERELTADTIWGVNDMIHIDKILHTEHMEGMIGTIESSPEQGSILYENRNKMMVIPRFRGKYVLKMINMYMLIPKYMYLLESPMYDAGESTGEEDDAQVFQLPSSEYRHPPLEAYTSENAVITDQISILDTPMFVDIPPIQALWSHVMRLIVNCAIRQCDFHDTGERVMTTIETMVSFEDPVPITPYDREGLVSLLTHDCTTQIYMVSKILLEYDIMGTIVGASEMNCIIDTIEYVFGYEDIATIDKWLEDPSDTPNPDSSDPIGIGPAIILAYIESCNDEITQTLLNRFIQYSQLTGVGRYQFNTTDTESSEMINTFDEADPLVRIIDSASSMDMHKYMRELSATLNSITPTIPFMSYQHVKVAKMFQHSSSTIYGSIMWIMHHENTPEETGDYIKSILSDEHVIPGIITQSPWTGLFESYYSAKHHGIAIIMINRINRVGKDALDELRTTHRLPTNKGTDYMLSSGTITPSMFNNAIDDNSMGLEYYASLNPLVNRVEKMIWEYTKEVTDLPRAMKPNTRDKWLSWEDYKENTQRHRKDYCTNAMSCGKCDDKCSCIRSYGGRRFLTCGGFKGFSEMFELFLTEIRSGLGMMRLDTLQRFCTALSQITNYDNCGSYFSHELDTDNVYDLLCCLLLFHLMRGTNIYPKCVKRFDIKSRTIVLDEGYLRSRNAKDRKIFDNKHKGVISHTPTADVLEYLFQKLLTVFHKICEESKLSYLRLEKDWNSLAIDTRKNMKKTMIYKYGKSGFLDDVLNSNDVACMFAVVMYELDCTIDPYNLIEPEIYKKSSNLKKMMKVMGVNNTSD